MMYCVIALIDCGKMACDAWWSVLSEVEEPDRRPLAMCGRRRQEAGVRVVVGPFMRVQLAARDGQSVAGFRAQRT